MTSDGRWVFSWDAENRLLKAESRTDTHSNSWRKVEWTYDAKGRRIGQKTWQWTNSTWQVIEDLKFVCDPVSVGRHILELNASNDAVARSYVWGLDLSGSLDGAGGVGGLLWVTMNSGPAAGTHFVAYDGNGNVVGLVSASTGTETARYEYGPFGEPIRVGSPAARANPFRFSTRRTDETTDLVLYEYRAYSPILGRWLSRDPIGEEGSENLYAFLHNAAAGLTDVLGLLDYRFEVTVGDPFSFASILAQSGRWGQPWWSADGSFLIVGARAYSSVMVTSRNDPGGSCNTVDKPDPAGTIKLFLRDECPGRFTVSIYALVQLTGTGPRGAAFRKVAGGSRLLIRGFGSTTAPFFEDGFYDFRVYVGKDWTEVAVYIPTVSLTQDFGVTSTGTAYGLIHFIAATR